MSVCLSCKGYRENLLRGKKEKNMEKILSRNEVSMGHIWNGD